ncbi:MAG: acyl-CoA synthetase [Deltaproteobacteria bacterium]|nr:acyl-CoA synthetase [Deltaproteobacteria bacterium]
MDRSVIKEKRDEMLAGAFTKGQKALSEFESKRFLSNHGIPVNQEFFVQTVEEATAAAKKIGYPVALKACGAALSHKSELGALALNVKGAREVRKEGARLLKVKGCEGLLVQEMVRGDRELVVGLTRHSRFGPCIMFGVGGVLTEVVKDVTFRVAPLTPADAQEMLEEIRGRKMLEAFRGQAPADVEEIIGVVTALGEIALRHEEVLQIDINPLKLRPDGKPVAVDALLVLSDQGIEQTAASQPLEQEIGVLSRPKSRESWAHFFEPQSVAIVGASSVPGKPGHDVVRNILANEYAGRVYLVNPKGEEILGVPAHQTISALPEGIDLAVVIVSADKSPQALRECIAKGIRHVVMAAGGFAEVDRSGAEIQKELTTLIRENGVHALGPNTSGHVSTPHKFTSTFFPLGKIRRGNISYIAQTGNFATHTMKYILSAEHFGVARVIGLGNAIDTDECDALESLEDDPETRAILMYLEQIKRPQRFLYIARRITRKKPVVMLKGGATEAGKQAAIAHTASMALEDDLVGGMLKQAGVVRIHEYTPLVLLGKALSMCSLPRGNRVAFLAPSGAMLVVLSDLCTRVGLEVPTLQPESLKRLRDISAPFILMRNPVDIWAAASVLGIEEGYKEGMEVVLKDPAIDAVVPILLLNKDTGIPSYDFIIELARKYHDKPILVSFTGEEHYMRECKAYLEPRGVPTFATIEDPFHVLSVMARCRKAMNRQKPF